MAAEVSLQLLLLVFLDVMLRISLLFPLPRWLTQPRDIVLAIHRQDQRIERGVGRFVSTFNVFKYSKQPWFPAAVG